MEIKELTRAELDTDIRTFLTDANLADRKWIWNYFAGLDEWPIIMDEVGGKCQPLLDK